jgi:hypothetical protein
VIVIPEAAWTTLLNEFARTVPGVEHVAFLDGVRTESGGVVTTVTIPDAELHSGYYDVSAEAMSEAGRHFRVHRLARLAQVHTHGGAGCRHSWRDDEKAYSHREGAVSIVLPYHAGSRPRPHDGVVHVRSASRWLPLDEQAAREAVRLVPSLLDFRSDRWIESPAATRATSTGVLRRFLRRVRRAWPFGSRPT